jgi:hypothetical protein
MPTAAIEAAQKLLQWDKGECYALSTGPLSKIQAMEIKRFYLACLAHASYLVHDGEEAAVIDPQRDVNLYIEEARQLGVSIRWVIETHLHTSSLVTSSLLRAPALPSVSAPVPELHSIIAI